MGAAIPLIRPISDLRANLNDVCEQAKQTREPIFMTKNGKASLVVFDSDAYAEMQARDRYAAKLREAEIEARYKAEAISRGELDAKMVDIFAQWEA